MHEDHTKDKFSQLQRRCGLPKTFQATFFKHLHPNLSLWITSSKPLDAAGYFFLLLHSSATL